MDINDFDLCADYCLYVFVSYQHTHEGPLHAYSSSFSFSFCCFLSFILVLLIFLCAVNQFKHHSNVKKNTTNKQNTHLRNSLVTHKHINTHTHRDRVNIRVNRNRRRRPSMRGRMSNNNNNNNKSEQPINK